MYAKIIKKQKNITQLSKKGAIIISDVQFDIDPGKQSTKDLYFHLINHFSGSIFDLKEGDYLKPGYYHYLPTFEGYEINSFQKIRVYNNTYKVLLGGYMKKKKK